MRAAADQSPAGDSLRLAVLAALNIADEAFRILDAEDGRPASLSSRLAAIERLIDEALEPRRRVRLTHLGPRSKIAPRTITGSLLCA